MGCGKTSCSHWPVIQGKPLKTVLLEGHNPLNSYGLTELKDMLKEKSKQVCKDLKITHITTDSTVLQIDDEKLKSDDFKNAIKKWYTENSLNFDNYEKAHLNIIRENMKVRNISYSHLKTRNDFVKLFKTILIIEVKYRREKHIEDSGGHILEDVSNIVVDLLHLQVYLIFFHVFK